MLMDSPDLLLKDNNVLNWGAIQKLFLIKTIFRINLLKS